MAKGDDIQERLIDFAVAIIKLASRLPNTPAGRHVAGQILRSGTSPAPNYGESRGAESRKDFIHKLKIALKELNETEVWLIIIERSELLPEYEVEPVLAECRELCKIIGSSIKTASGPKE
jgi:four helix bundle protein